MMPLEILFADDALVAVNKPSGQAVHQARGAQGVPLVADMRAHLGVDTVYPVHRIDRGTSGVVLFARTAELAAVLNQRFADGAVKKSYLALVRGVPPDAGEIDHPIPRRVGGPRVAARSSFSTLCSVDIEPRALSLVLVQPHNGRLHQVRRHLKHISHPVIGDANYGKGPLNREIATRYGLHRLALHARQLELDHPTRSTRIAIVAPLPADLSAPLVRMGFFPP